MRRSVVSLVLCFSVVSSASLCCGQQKKEKGSVSFRIPVRQYVPMPVLKRTIQVERQLANENPKLMHQALRRLSSNIDKANSIIPPEHGRLLQTIPFFLMYGSDADAGGRDSGLVYFQRNAPSNRDWLDPSWGSSIVVYSAKNDVGLTDLWAIKAVTHELAHAFQLEQWPEKQSHILYACENAMARGLYHGVRDDKGKTIDKAHATSNQLEYFAELSCMYFVGCNYHPKDRRTLRSYDPTGCEMIQQVWSVERAPKPTKFPRRVWMDTSGDFRLIARFVKQSSTTVTLQKDDQSEVEVQRSRLSKLDHSHLQWLESVGHEMVP